MLIRKSILLLSLALAATATSCTTRYQDMLRERDDRIRELSGDNARLRVENDELQRRPAAPVEADLMISTDVAAREAEARGHAVEREILLYAVHGTLHACGYRDDTEESFRAIHAEEDRILAAGGLGAVYARPVRDERKDSPP